MLDHLRGDRLVGIGRDQALPVEVRARLHPDGRLVREHAVLVVEAIEPGRDPVRSGFEHDAAQARIALEHPRAQHLGERGHHVDGQEDDAEEAVRRVAPLPLPEPLPVAHDHMEANRHLEILRRLPEPREDRVVEVASAAGGEVR